MKIIIIAAFFIGAASLNAQESAFQLSLTPDIAIQSRTTDIEGLSLGIWSENPQHSLTLGFVNGSTGDSGGFSLAFIFNYDDSYTGVQWAVVNYSKQNFVGWQSGFVDYAEGSFKGLQFGLINYAETLDGLQIGLFNVAMNNPMFDEFPDKLAKGFPIVNWSF